MYLVFVFTYTHFFASDSVNEMNCSLFNGSLVIVYLTKQK
jgi:hypothetical protein